MKSLIFCLTAGLLSFLAAVPSQGSVIVSYAESPGVYNSTLANSSYYDFNSLPTGVNSNIIWKNAQGTTVGTFDKLNILNADVYGGAPVTSGNSRYAVEGLTSNLVAKTTLTLATPSAYFGLWWSAGDSQNVMSFYSSGSLVAQFTTAILLSKLPRSYYSNPTPTYTGQNSGEPYAFLNFFAMGGSTWDTVTFSNSASTGFEWDNPTSRVAAYSSTTDGPMPGVVFETINGTTELVGVPEPSTWAALVAAIGGILLMVYSRRRVPAA